MANPKGEKPWKPNKAIAVNTTRKPNPDYVAGVSPKEVKKWIPVEGPYRSMIQLTAEICEVIERDERDWPITQRTWLYRLMSDYGWKKHWEDHLQYILNRGRRAGLISWDAIDGGRSLSSIRQCFDSVPAMINACARLPLRLEADIQVGQARRVVLWTETRGYFSLLAGVASHYGADLYSGGGFDTTTAKQDAAKRIANFGAVTVLHIGDLDASGETIANAGVRADVGEFVRQMGGDMVVKRIGLLDCHIDEYGLAWETPPVSKCNHAFSGKRIAQCEALTSEQTRDLVSRAFEAELDMDLLNQQRDKQDEIRKEAARVLQLAADSYVQE